MDRRPVLPLSVRPAAHSRCGATENFLHQVSIAQRIVRAIVGLVAICIGLDFAADLHRYGLPARTMPIIAGGSIAAVILISGAKGLLVVVLAWVFATVCSLAALFMLPSASPDFNDNDFLLWSVGGAMAGTTIGIRIARWLNCRRSPGIDQH